MIVPGGRFIEFYYWDSYWIIKGRKKKGDGDEEEKILLGGVKDVWDVCCDVCDVWDYMLGFFLSFLMIEETQSVLFLGLLISQMNHTAIMVVENLLQVEEKRRERERESERRGFLFAARQCYWICSQRQSPILLESFTTPIPHSHGGPPCPSQGGEQLFRRSGSKKKRRS